MRILYFSCHEILEYDDVRLLTEAGHTVFSLGGSTTPGWRGRFRNGEPDLENIADSAAWVASGCGGPLNLSHDFARSFDVALVNHVPEWAHAAVEAMGDKLVVYRSIGQSTPASEALLAPIRNRIRVVRYANGEARLPDFLPSDAVIYFGKRSDDFKKGWRGGKVVRTFHNAYLERSAISLVSAPDWQALARGRSMELWGSDNLGMVGERGVAPADLQADLFRTAAAYFYTPVLPTSYTLSFIEALGYGVPILAPSTTYAMRRLDRATLRALGFNIPRYEVPTLLNHEEGQLFHDMVDAGRKLDDLLSNSKTRKRASAVAKQTFANVFESRTIGAQWTQFFQKHI